MGIETIGIFINATAAVLVFLMGLLVAERKTKIEKLKSELLNVYKQYGMLYKVEDSLLSKLQETEYGNKRTIKSETRKEIVGDSDVKITLTEESVKSRINKIKHF